MKNLIFDWIILSVAITISIIAILTNNAENTIITSIVSGLIICAVISSIYHVIKFREFRYTALPLFLIIIQLNTLFFVIPKAKSDSDKKYSVIIEEFQRNHLMIMTDE